MRQRVSCTSSMNQVKGFLCSWLVLSLAALCIAAPASKAFGSGGAIIWQAGDPQAGKQIAKTSVVDRQGNVIVTGYQNLGGVNDYDNYYTAKFKADGSGVAWRKTFGQNGGNNQATAVVIDSNNDVIVTGYMWNGVNDDIHTIKYQGSDGTVLWEHTWNGAANGNDRATSIAVDSLNNVFVGGPSQGSSGTDDFITLKYAANGPINNAPAWQAIYNGATNGEDDLYAITAGVNGIAVTGWSNNGTQFDMLTVKYDFSGNKLWEVRYPSAGGAMGKKVRMDATGNVIVTGYTAVGVLKNIYTAKYRSSDGFKLWEKSYANPNSQDAESNDLFIDTTGDVFITGYTFTYGGLKKVCYTARYNGSTGSLIWDATSNEGSEDDDATAIVVDGDGDVYITGYAVSGDNYDFLTIKYKRASGSQQWSQRFNGTANLDDRAVGIGIGLSPSGDVLVAGWSDSGPNNPDYYVIKYDPEMFPPPTNLIVSTVSNTSIQLFWVDNSANEESFKVERKLGEMGVYNEVATLSPNTTTYLDNGLSAYNTYYYRVRAYNSAEGYSHYSNEVHALSATYNAVAFAQSYKFNNPDNKDDFLKAIAIGADENPVITGYSQTAAFGNNYTTIKLNRSDLNPIWNAQYDDPDSGTDEAMCLAIDSNNDVVVSGYATLYYTPVQANIYSIYTIKYPSNGPPETWERQYNGPGGIDDRPIAVATSMDANNNVVVVGYGLNAAGNTDIYVLKYDQAGALKWSAPPFDGPGHGFDIPSAAAFGPDGSVYVTGYTEKSAGSGKYSFYTAKYTSLGANGLGTLIWSDLYSVQPTGDNRGNAITVDASGDVYVTGSATNASGNADIYTIKYSGSATAAQRLWERFLDGAGHGNDTGESVRIDPYDSAIVVAGTTLTGLGNNDFTVVRYTPSGDQIWQKTLLRPSSDDTLKGMAIDPSGTIYITGDTVNGSNVDILSAIVEPGGGILAFSVFDGASHGFDQAVDVVTDTKGEAFIGGYTTNASGNADYIVLKQNSTNYVIPIPIPFKATQQADYSKINLTWSNNLPGTGFRIERALGPVSTESNWIPIATVAAGTSSFQDNGLNPNTNYCYRIEAYSGSLGSLKVISCATTTLPAPVMNLTLVSATAIDVTWGNVTGNTGYKLERSLDNSAWSQIGGGNLVADTALYHDTGLTAGAVYYYRVSTISSFGASLATLQIVPVLTSATAVSSTEIDLTWPAVSGVTAYLLERSTDNANWSQIVSQTATSYQNSSLPPGSTYYYRLKVVTAVGTSIPSLVRSSQSWPATPTLSTVTAVSPGQINLTWTSAVGATGYTVWESSCNNIWTTSSNYWNASTSKYVNYPVPYSPGNCDNYPQYIGWTATTNVGSTGQGVTTFNRTGLNGGTYYSYYIVATASSSVSPGSNTLKAWTPVSIPTLSATTVTDTSVSLSWNYTNGWTGSTLERSLDGTTGWTPIKSNSGANNAYYYLSYTDPNLSPSTTYYYRLTVTGVVAPPAVSSVLAVTTKPGGPAITSVTLAGNQITVNWNNLAGNLGYEVKRLSTADANPTTYWSDGGIISTTIPQDTPTYINTTLTPGVAYKYQVRAKLAGGTYSGWGSDSGIWRRTAPPTPSYIYTNGTSVNWGSAAGAAQYYYQSKNPTGGDCSTGTWSSSTSTTSTFTSVLNSNTTASCYQVQSHNESGDSGWSSAAIYLPPPTTFTPGTATVSSIPLTWSNVTGNTGYFIERYPYYYSCQQWNGSSYYWTTCGPIWTTASNTAPGATSFTDTGLISNYTYQYRISTRYTNGGYGGASVSKVSTPTSKATLPLGNMTLTGLTVDSYSQITINWSDVAGNNGYKIQRSPDNAAWTDIITTVPGAVSYTDTGLNSGTRYYYRGQAKDGAGTFTLVSNALNGVTPLMTPTISSITAVSEARIDLGWQVVPSATNYKVLRSIGPSGPWTQVSNPAVAYATLYCGKYNVPVMDCNTLLPVYTSYSNTGLTENTNYCYQVKAWNAVIGDSASSTPVCSNTLSLGGPNLTAVATIPAKRLIQLTWSYNPSACTPTPCAPIPDGFEVWRLASNGQWALVTKTSNATTFTDKTNIEPQYVYNYKVRAYKGTDMSAFSNVRSVTTPTFSLTDGTCQ